MSVVTIVPGKSLATDGIDQCGSCAEYIVPVCRYIYYRYKWLADTGNVQGPLLCQIYLEGAMILDDVVSQ